MESTSDLRTRTKAFALEVIQFSEVLPRNRSSDIIAKQLLRCATSVGANYRSASYAKSPADMIAKLKIVEEEVDEASYWLELLEDSGLVASESTSRLRDQAGHIFRMVVSSIKTLRAKPQR